MATNELKERVNIQEVREVLFKAETGIGGWVVAEDVVRVDLGNGRTFDYVQRRIFTKQNHPQIKQQAPVVTLSTCSDGQKVLRISKEDAHLIANAPRWLAGLCDEVQALRDENEKLHLKKGEGNGHP